MNFTKRVIIIFNGIFFLPSYEIIKKDSFYLCVPDREVALLPKCANALILLQLSISENWEEHGADLRSFVTSLAWSLLCCYGWLGSWLCSLPRAGLCGKVETLCFFSQSRELSVWSCSSLLCKWIYGCSWCWLKIVMARKIFWQKISSFFIPIRMD